MPGGYLYGWDPVNEIWVKMICDADGYLKIDPSEIFEDDPTEDLSTKGPSSKWAFAHKALPGAHHNKFTAAESRAAINNVLSSTGAYLQMCDVGFHELRNATIIRLQSEFYADYFLMFQPINNGQDVKIMAYESGVGWVAANFYVWDGADDRKLCTEIIADNKITTHKNITNAHHAKYTDANAQVACNLSGDLYWARPGNNFLSRDPQKHNYTRAITGQLICDENGIDFMVAVNLPHGCTVTGVIVYGDETAEGKTWELQGVKLTDLTLLPMATATVNTTDSSIDDPIIDNSLYGYCIHVIDYDINMEIYGARITYTL